MKEKKDTSTNKLNSQERILSKKNSISKKNNIKSEDKDKNNDKKDIVLKIKKVKKRKINKNIEDSIVSEQKINNNNSMTKVIFNNLLWMVIGFIFCILFLFALTGGKNYFKLYYELREFIDIYDVITNDYYGNLDKEELISGSIDAMFDNINDYYTTYIDKESTDNFLKDVNGTYEGIGCMVSTNKEGEIFIVEVFEDSPSSKAGLLEDDIVLKVDNVDYSTKNSLEMSEYIKNSDLDEVKLTVKRGEELIEIVVKREKVEIPSVNGQVVEYEGKKIGYITIDVFSSVSYHQTKTKLKKLEKEGIDGLVIDVRSNSGGYLDAVTDISSLFLQKGKIIYQLEDSNSVQKIKDSTKEYTNYPIAVLVNAGSASASEIFAAAIKESYGGFVVGTNTYGKGTVQKTKVLTNGSMIKYTIQNWLTPKGNFINEIGITPTHVVELDFRLEYDNQLEEAIKLVSE